MSLPTELDPTDSAESGLETPTIGAPRRRGAIAYFLATLVGQVSALARYVVMARLLGPEQLGLAATLVVTAAFFDMISDTGSDRFLVQDSHGDTPQVQSLVQLVFVSRGAMVAAALAIFSAPIAWIYHEPRLIMGLTVLGLAPLIRGFTHLDTRRLQRRHDFRSDSVSIMAGEFASLIVTIVAAVVVKNFTAILYGLIARSAVSVLVSHLRSERPYSLKWSKDHGPRLIAFATPLMFNGLILFVGSQGDRLLVGNQLGVKALGIYSAILLLIYYPAGIIYHFLVTMFIPMVAEAREDRNRLDHVLDDLGGQCMLLCLAMAVGFALVTPFFGPLLYGARFKQPALLIGLIGLLQTARFLALWPTATALGMGRSHTVLISNLARVCVFPTAFAGLRLFGGLAGIVAGFAFGEFLAVAVSLALANRAVDRSLFVGFDRLAYFALTGLAIVGWNIADPLGSGAILFTLFLGSLALAVFVVHREWRHVQGILGIVNQRARTLKANVQPH